MKPKAKLTIPEVIEEFAAFHAKHPGWGELHTMMSDGNWKDKFLPDPSEMRDHEARRLAKKLAKLSPGQRKRLADKVSRGG